MLAPLTPPPPPLQVSAVQVSPTQVSIDIFTTKQHMELKSDIQIKGTFVTVDQVVIWSGRRVVVYEFSPDAQHARVVGKILTMLGVYVICMGFVCGWVGK